MLSLLIRLRRTEDPTIAERQHWREPDLSRRYLDAQDARDSIAGLAMNIAA
ncbi:MAG: hypothetical protein N838_10255 [Thiohalocapsa sp. PB-PSB1]|nr:MAG: hypothetical protein N838_10255 [Thiohalocapsa sp. PB-PSB1]